MSTSLKLLGFLSRVYLDRHRGVGGGWEVGRDLTLMQPSGGWQGGGTTQSNRHFGNNSSQSALYTAKHLVC